MKTLPIFDDGGRKMGFEVSPSLITLSRLGSVLESVSGVTNVRVRKPFSRNPDVRIRFLYREKQFVVVEPWGDGNSYLIGPDDPNAEEVDTDDIELALTRYKPSLLQALFDKLPTISGP